MNRVLVGLIFAVLLTACSGQQAATPTALPDPTIAPTDVPTEVPAETAEIITTEEALAGTEEIEESSAVTTEEVAVNPQTPTELCAEAVPAVDPANRQYTEPAQVLQPGVDYRAVFCTDAGPIYIDLFEDYAPVTVNSFVFLAQNDYYNNTVFHRVIADFMAQGGDPTATGSGGPGYQFRDEFVGFLTFDRPGWLAMANANRPEQNIVGTNGSQFFITTVETPHLDFRHTIFGEVLEGQANVQNIMLRDPAQADSPATQLQTVVIITNPDAVTTTYQSPVKATREEVVAVFAEFASTIPADLEMVNSSEPLTIETVTSTVPEQIRGEYETFLGKYNYEFGMHSLIDNISCNLENYVFVTLGYKLDAFESAEAASQALSDGFLDTLAAEEGFVKSGTKALGADLYTRQYQACSTEVTAGRIYVLRGRFIATIESSIPADRPYTVDLIMEQFTERLYESTLSAVLRPEMR